MVTDSLTMMALQSAPSARLSLASKMTKSEPILTIWKTLRSGILQRHGEG